MNQKRLNKDIQDYCDIAWGLKELRDRQTRPIIYRNIELVSTPQTPNGRNPIVVCTDNFKMIKDKVVEIPKPKKLHWLVRLFRKVIGIK